MNWLFTGDSITHGVVHSNGLKRFSEYFEDVLRTHSILCQNRSKDVVLNTGVSSATSSWMAQYWDSFVAQRNADVVFITYGMNDGRADKPVTDLAQFKTNLSTAIDKIRESGAIPILMTQNDTRQAQANKNLSPYFAAEREMARAKHVMMIDYNSWWQENGDGGANTAWTNDDLHPNQIGHLNWAKFILQELGLAKDARLMATAQAQVPASGATVKTKIQSFAGASGLSNNGLKYAPKKNFDGSAADQITAGVPENTAANNGNITVRFRMDEARNGVNYVLAALEDEQSAKVVTVGVYNGEIRVGRDLGNGQNYGYYTRGGANPGDGNFHIASINYGQNGLTIYLDGQKLAPISGWTQPPSFFAADKLTVGGFGRSYSAGQTFSHLKGAIDYVEVYGQNLTEEQIASLGNDAAPVAEQLRNLYASTQPQMWAFLGGATTQGTLPEISAKNYVQAFEEVVRWEYRSNPAGMRMKFVQNAGLNGLSAKDLLARYDAVIAAQNPNVMVISPDVKFKNKLVETSVADFTAHILALVEKATAANTYVILMSPAQLGADIAEYAQALKQIAAEKKLTYVDGYEWLAAVAANNASGVVAQEWFDANSFMRAKGQIELAKHFMGVIQMLPENLGTSKIWALNYDGDGTPATLNVPDYRQGSAPQKIQCSRVGM
ncbi:GDSL-type esterase/lipase family protein [Arcanobacterium hippocoleae]|uniref:GDSL-type esterase/lipase family protein n=1 Tax=Arcanobacterium hippocoleae TaxID=149017 RepID=UPI003341A2BB